MNTKYKRLKRILAFTMIFALLVPNFVFAEDLSGSDGAIDKVALTLQGGSGNLVLTLNNGNTPDWISWIVVDKEYDEANNTYAINFPGAVEDIPPLTEEGVHAAGWEQENVIQGKTATIPVNVDSTYYGKEMYVLVRTSLTPVLQTKATTDASGNTNEPKTEVTSVALKTPTAPAIGAAVADSPEVTTDTAGLGTISAAWSGANGSGNTWADGDIPVLTVTVPTDRSHQFGSISANAITASNGTATHSAVTAGASSVSVTVTYDAVKATEISSVDLAITAPVKGETPQTAVANGTGYTGGTITWDPTDKPFGYNKAYKATVTLTTDATHKFAAGASATVNTTNSASVTVNGTTAGNTMEVAFTFPNTETKKTPNVADFVIANTPVDYDNTAKTPVVNVKTGVTGMGSITNLQVDGSANVTNAGTYNVTFDVAEGTDYQAASITMTNGFTVSQVQYTTPALTKTDVSTIGATDGKITITNLVAGATYEYSSTSASSGFSDATLLGTGSNEIQGLAAGTYYVRVKGDANHTVSEAESITIGSPTPSYDISADVVTDFAALTYGSAVTGKTITFTNDGNATQTITADLVGDNAGSFALSGSPQNNVTAAGKATFTLTPNANLDAGTYKVKVKASSNHSTEATTDEITLVVNQAELTATTLTATKVYDGTNALQLKDLANKELNGVNNEKLTLSSITGAQYTSVDQHGAAAITVKGAITATGVNGSKPGNYDLTKLDNLTINGSISKATISAVTAPTGTVTVGETLTVGALTVDNALPPGYGTDYTVKWYRSDADGNNETEILGQTANTYVLAKDDVNKLLYVKVSGTGNYTGTDIVSAKTTAVPKIAMTGTPNIKLTTDQGVTGNADVDDILSIELTGMNVTAADVDIQWKSGDANVGSLNDTTYTITADDVTNEKVITAVVTAKVNGNYTGIQTSNQITAGKANIASIGNIAGNLKYGETLTAGALEPVGATVTYQWYRADNNAGENETAIDSANSNSYVLGLDDIGKYIRVKAEGNGTYKGTVYTAYTTSAIEKADGPVAPLAVTKVDVAANDDTTGKLENVDNTMEYALSDTFENAKAIEGNTVEGLEAGTYYVRVKATETTKAGVATNALVIAPAEPNQVKNVTVSSGNQKLTVQWAAPKMNGGTFTKYIVDIQAAGVSVAGYPKDITSADTLSEVVTGLTNGTDYSVTVQAVNNLGDGLVSQVVTGKPKSTSGGGSSSGGSSSATKVTEYTVTYNAGSNGTLAGDKTEKVEKDKTPSDLPKVTAKDGYRFLGWSTDGKTVVDPADVKITKNTTFTALYEKVGAIDHLTYINGMGEGSFGPNGNMTRAEAVTMLDRLHAGFEDKAYENKFDDVTASNWFFNYVTYGANNGIVEGYEDGTFQPNATITRAEFAAMLSRFAGLTAEGTTEYADVTGHWAAGSIAALQTKGIVNGYEDNTFRPNQTITRAEAVKMINGAIGRTPDKIKVEANLQYYTNPFNDVAASHWAYYEILEAAIAHYSGDFH